MSHAISSRSPFPTGSAIAEEGNLPIEGKPTNTRTHYSDILQKICTSKNLQSDLTTLTSFKEMTRNLLENNRSLYGRKISSLETFCDIINGRVKEICQKQADDTQTKNRINEISNTVREIYSQLEKDRKLFWQKKSTSLPASPASRLKHFEGRLQEGETTPIRSSPATPANNNSNEQALPRKLKREEGEKSPITATSDLAKAHQSTRAHQPARPHHPCSTSFDTPKSMEQLKPLVNDYLMKRKKYKSSYLHKRVHTLMGQVQGYFCKSTFDIADLKQKLLEKKYSKDFVEALVSFFEEWQEEEYIQPEPPLSYHFNFLLMSVRFLAQDKSKFSELNSVRNSDLLFKNKRAAFKKLSENLKQGTKRSQKKIQHKLRKQFLEEII